MRETWQRFWYSASSPNLLCRGRALFCGALFLDSLTQNRAIWADLSPVFFNPTTLVRVVGMPSYQICSLLEIVWQGFLLLAALGLWTRGTVFTSALLGTFVMGIPSSFCSFGQGNHHHYNVPCIMLWVLAFSRCGDAFSIDSLRRPQKVQPSGEYTWPIRMICITLCSMMLTAGLMKMRFSGFSWVLPDNLSRYLIYRHYFPRTIPPVDWGLVVSQIPAFCFLMASSGLALEVFYPVGLLNGVWPDSKWRWTLLVPAGTVVMLLLIRVLVGPLFLMVAVAHIFWWPQRTDGRICPPSAKKQKLVAALLSVILTGSTYAFVFKKEDFPFSWYPMFASISKPQLTRYLLFGVDSEGREWILESRRTHPPEDPSLDRISLHRSFGVLLDNPDDLETGVRDCLRRYRKIRNDLVAIRLYKCQWDINVELEGRDDPERKLIVEVE